MMADLTPYFDRMSMMPTPTGKDLERVGHSMEMVRFGGPKEVAQLDDGESDDSSPSLRAVIE
jgi:hypothetical protein